MRTHLRRARKILSLAALVCLLLVAAWIVATDMGQVVNRDFGADVYFYTDIQEELELYLNDLRSR